MLDSRGVFSHELLRNRRSIVAITILEGYGKTDRAVRDPSVEWSGRRKWTKIALFILFKASQTHVNITFLPLFKHLPISVFYIQKFIVLEMRYAGHTRTIAETDNTVLGAEVGGCSVIFSPVRAPSTPVLWNYPQVTCMPTLITSLRTSPNNNITSKITY